MKNQIGPEHPASAKEDTDAPEQSAGIPRLVRSKLSPPLPPSTLVARTRFDQWYESAESKRLVLLRAPAGFGKTTVMLQWRARAEQEGRTAVWLTLDSGENDPARFLAYLGAAFQQIDPPLDLGFTAAPHLLGGALPATLRSNLLLWAASREKPFTLFLDEFEGIHNPDVHQVLRQLLEVLSPGCRIVLSTRETPDIPLARMRSRGQALAIGAEELRFDQEEAGRFFPQGGNPSLRGDDVAHLHRCTEGWAAGLQLTRLALADRRDPSAFLRSLSGSFAHISDYLHEEVLIRQPESVRDFLLKTSILGRLSGPLCDAVTGGGDGYKMLAYLERANLFVTPLDNERRWYRYHNLFAQFLQSRLVRGPGDRVTALHSAAADWFETKAAYGDAAEHAFAAGAPERAAGLLARWAKTLTNLGQMDTVLGWAERLPKGAVEAQPELWVAHCWALVFRRHNYEEARESIARLCAAAPLEDPALRDEALALQGVALNLEERVEEAYRVCEENLSKISDRRSFAFGVLGDALGASLIWAGKLDKAEECLTRVRESQSHAEGSIQTVYCDSTLGLLRLTQGRLGEALSLYRSAYSHALESSPAHSLPRAVAAASLALALFEMDELEEAEALFADHLPVLREHRPLDLAATSYSGLSRIYLQKGREGDLERLLEEADRFGRAPGSLCLAGIARLERIRCALWRGDVSQAERDTRELCDGPAWSAFRSRAITLCEPDAPGVLRARVMLAKGQPSQALSDLRSLLPAVRSAGRLRLALTLQILEAAALEACGQRRPALRALTQALQFGSREGFIRAFADEGPAVIRLIEELRTAGLGLEEEGTAGSAPPTDYLDRILSAAGVPPSPAPHRTRVQEVALTAREVEILRLLNNGLSRQETAEHLFVSLATVKYHLANITRKLGVANRRQAVSEARRRGLLGG